MLIVNLNPGGIAGGSGAQYFVGDFDGTTFTADNKVGDVHAAAGRPLRGLRGRDLRRLDARPATRSAPVPPRATSRRRAASAGYLGNGLANSFHNEDRGTGHADLAELHDQPPVPELPRRRRQPPARPGDQRRPGPRPGPCSPTSRCRTATGRAGRRPARSRARRPPHGTIGDQQPVSGYEGSQLVNTFIDHDNGTGHITSPEFTITSDYINFLIGGGSHPYPGDAGNPPTAVNLVVDGQVVRSSTGQDGEALNWTNWNVSELKGKTAQIDIVDENTGGWGHINADQFTFADEPAFPRSTETAVNLLVDGKVVRTATGPNSETARLDGVEPRATSSARARRSSSSTATPAAGATSWPTTSRSPTSRRSRCCSAAAGWTTARTSTPRSPGTTCPTGAGSRSGG